MKALRFRLRVDDTLPVSPGSGPQLSHEASQAHCDIATITVEQRHRQVIALLVRQIPVDEIAMATGYSSRWVRKIAHRFRTSGPVALGDLRHHNTGAEPLLSVEQQYELQQAFQLPPPDGGEWTGPKVAHWIEAKTGQRVHRQRGWEYLRRLRAASSPLTKS